MIQKFFAELGDVLTKAPKAALKLPGARAVAGISPSSPLDLFDTAATQGLHAPGWYWKGQSMRVIKGAKRGIHGLTEADPSVGTMRKLGWGAAGGLLASSMVGFDPMGATSMAGSAANLGFHGALGGTMYNLGGKTRMLGMGYLGLAGINLFRKGDQIGPL